MKKAIEGITSGHRDPEKDDYLIESEDREEDIFDLVKGNGPWQWRVVFVLCLFSIPGCMQNLSMTFFAPNIDYWCARPPGANITVKEWKRFGLPPHDTKCSRYKEIDWNGIYGKSLNPPTDREIVPCSSWEYDHSLYSSTVLEKWNLVCEHEWYVSLSKSIFTFGFMCSVFVFGQLADKYGRKPIIAFCNMVGVVSSLLSAFSSSFAIFAVWRYIIAVGVIAAETVAFVLRVEVVGPEVRALHGSMGVLPSVFGHMFLLFLAMTIRDWFWIQNAMTIISVLLISTWWMMPESPRWLLAHGKIDKAKDVLLSAGRSNGVNMEKQEAKVHEMLIRTNKTEEAKKEKSSLLQLFTEARMRKQTFIIFYIWFVTAFVYWGLTYNTNELAGDPFLNFAAYGLVELPAVACILIAMKYKGRKFPLIACYLATGTGCLLIYFIPKDSWWLSTCALLAGKFFIGSAFTIIYIFTAELMPTVLRNSGIGAASTVARFGNILAPFVRELGNATHPFVPQLLFGVLAVTAGILVAFLPETTNSNMPDTLEEASEISRTQLLKKYRA